MIKQNHKV